MTSNDGSSHCLWFLRPGLTFPNQQTEWLARSMLCPPGVRSVPTEREGGDSSERDRRATLVGTRGS